MSEAAPFSLVLSNLQGARPIGGNGKSFVAKCPSHADQHPSLSVTEGHDGRVLLNCHAGCRPEDVVGALGLRMTDIMPPRSEPTTRPRPTLAASTPPRTNLAPITVEDLARDKKLPEQFLRELGLEDRPGGVVIAYRQMDGSLAPRQRLRTALSAKDGSSWLGGQGAITPYGLDRLLDAREEGFLVLAEGESDAWVLWSHGVPCLSVPGASLTKTLQPEYLMGISELYYWREPDQGGDTFAAGVVARLTEIGYTGKIHEVKLAGTKDPAELHQRNPEAFYGEFCKVLGEAILVTPPMPSPPVVVLEEMRSRTVRELVLDDTLEQPEQVLEGLLALGELTVLGGAPKSYKSWSAKTIGLCIAGGKPWLGFNVPKPYKVLYLSAEGREVRLKSRFQLLLAKLDVPEEAFDNFEYVTTMGRLKLDTDTGEKTFLRLIEPFPVVIIDPYYRFISDGDENSHKDQRIFQDLMDRVKGMGKCVLLVHHTRKPTGGVDTGISELRGAGLDGFADGVLMLRRKRDELENLFTLRFTLRNYDEPDDKDLVRSGVLLVPAPPPNPISLCGTTDILNILSGTELPGDELKNALAEEKECSKSTIERAIKQALHENLIAYKPKPGKGRGRIYYRPEDQATVQTADPVEEPP